MHDEKATRQAVQSMTSQPALHAHTCSHTSLPFAHGPPEAAAALRCPPAGHSARCRSAQALSGRCRPAGARRSRPGCSRWHPGAPAASGCSGWRAACAGQGCLRSPACAGLSDWPAPGKAAAAADAAALAASAHLADEQPLLPPLRLRRHGHGLLPQAGQTAARNLRGGRCSPSRGRCSNRCRGWSVTSGCRCRRPPATSAWRR